MTISDDPTTKRASWPVMPILIALVLLGIATPFFVNRYRTGQLARNEQAVVQLLRDLAKAQEAHFQQKKEYAGAFSELGGQWASVPEIDAPVAEGEALQTAHTANPETSSGIRQTGPKRPALHGYRFRILKGRSGEKGSQSFLGPDGRMTEGFAVLAAPEKYGFTGKDTFLMLGRDIYVKDFDAFTDQVTQPLYHFVVPDGAKKIE
ncbi:MAG TPA: DUF2950 family protein [Planctomycetota bacterium]|nr:DUF2950 family protein [Planctomycetota bacterium]